MSIHKEGKVFNKKVLDFCDRMESDVNPDYFNMDLWYVLREKCGTVACAAGWKCQFDLDDGFIDKIDSDGVMIDGNFEDYDKYAASALDIPCLKGLELFIPSRHWEWPGETRFCLTGFLSPFSLGSVPPNEDYEPRLTAALNVHRVSCGLAQIGLQRCLKVFRHYGYGGEIDWRLDTPYEDMSFIEAFNLEMDRICG